VAAVRAGRTSGVGLETVKTVTRETSHNLTSSDFFILILFDLPQNG
jgi:hypothetical protein